MGGKRTVAHSLLLIALVWISYSNSLQNPFEFDDWHVIPQNPEVRGPADIPGFFVDVSKFSILPGNRDYRPLSLTLLALSWWIGGGSTLPFHLVSVGLHAGNVVLLFFLLRLCARRWLEAGDAHEGVAFVGAAMFAVHPAASEAILYISSQSVPLAAFFYLLAVFLFLTVYSTDRSSRPSRSGLRRFGSYVAYAMALLSKPIAITLPLNLLAWEALLGSTAAQDDSQERSLAGRTWSRLRKHIPFALVSVAFVLLRSSVAGNPVQSLSAVGSSSSKMMVHYLTQTKALALYYLKLAIMPIGLNVDLQYPQATSILEMDVVLSLLVLVVIAGLLVRYHKQRLVVFWSLWFPICLLLTTYVVVLGQTVREARLYLSLVGYCAVAALLLFKLWDVLPIRISDSTIGQRSGRVVLGMLTCGVLVLLTLATRARAEIWSSGLALWGDAATKNGTWRAHMNYGLALDSAGRHEEALSSFKTAVDMGPYAWSHLNLGLAYIRRDLKDQGLEHLRTAVSLWPASPEVHYYLGRGLASTGDLEGAEAAYLKALELRDNYLLALESLGQLYRNQGRTELALTSYRRLLDLEPSSAEYKKRVEALEAGTPDIPVDALFELAFVAQQQGKRVEAIGHYERLLELAPDHGQATFNLAYAYRDGVSAEDWNHGAELFERVLEIDPEYSEALFHLATLYRKLGRFEEAEAYDRLYLERGSHEDLKKASAQRLGNGR